MALSWGEGLGLWWQGEHAFVATCRRREQTGQPATHSLISDLAFIFRVKRAVVPHRALSNEALWEMCPALCVWGSCVAHPVGATVSLSVRIPAPRLVWTSCRFSPFWCHLFLSRSSSFMMEGGKCQACLCRPLHVWSGLSQTRTQPVPTTTLLLSLWSLFSVTLTVIKPVVNVFKFFFLISDYLCQYYFARRVIVNLPCIVVLLLSGAICYSISFQAAYLYLRWHFNVKYVLCLNYKQRSG